MMKLTLYFALIYQVTRLTGGFITLGGINNLIWSPPSCIACYHNEANNYFSNLDRLIPRCASEEIYEFRRIEKMFFVAHICEYQTGTGFQFRYLEIQTRGKMVLNKFKTCLKKKPLTNLGKEKLKEFTISFENARRRCEDENFLESSLKDMRNMYFKPTPKPLQGQKKIKKPKYKKPAKNHYTNDQAEGLLKYSTGEAEKPIAPTIEESQLSNTPLENLTTDQENENNKETFVDAEDSFEDKEKNEETTSENVSTPTAEIETFEDQSTPLTTDAGTDQIQYNDGTPDNISNPIGNPELSDDQSALASPTQDNIVELVQNETIDSKNTLNSTKNHSEASVDELVDKDATLEGIQDPETNLENAEEVIEDPIENNTVAEKTQDTPINLDNSLDSPKSESEQLKSDTSEENITAEKAQKDETNSKSLPDDLENQSNSLINDKINFGNNPISTDNQLEPQIEDPIGKEVMTEEIQNTDENLGNTLDSSEIQPESSVDKPIEKDINVEEPKVNRINSINPINSIENESEELIDSPVETNATVEEKQETEINLENKSEEFEDDSTKKKFTMEIQGTEINLENTPDSSKNKSKESNESSSENDTNAKDIPNIETNVENAVEENNITDNDQDKINLENVPGSSKNQAEPLINDLIEDNAVVGEIQDDTVELKSTLDSSKNESEPLMKDLAENNTLDTEDSNLNPQNEPSTPTQVQEDLNNLNGQPNPQGIDAFASDAHDEEIESEDSLNSETQSEPLANETAAEDLPQVENDPTLETDNSTENLTKEQSAPSIVDDQLDVQENNELVPLQESLIAAPVGNAETKSSESLADQLKSPSSDTLVENTSQIQNDDTLQDTSESSSNDKSSIKLEDPVAIEVNDSQLGSIDESMSKNDSLDQLELQKASEEILKDQSLPITENNSSIEDNSSTSKIDTYTDNSAEMKSNEDISPQNTDSSTEEMGQIQKNDSIEDNSTQLIPESKLEKDPSQIVNNPITSIDSLAEIKSDEEATPQNMNSLIGEVGQIQNNDSTEDNSIQATPEIKSEIDPSSIVNDPITSTDSLVEMKSKEEVAPQKTEPFIEGLGQIQQNNSIIEDDSAPLPQKIKSEEEPLPIVDDSFTPKDHLVEMKSENEIIPQNTNSITEEESQIQNNDSLEDSSALSLPEIKIKENTSLIADDTPTLTNNPAEIKPEEPASQNANFDIEQDAKIQKGDPIIENNPTESLPKMKSEELSPITNNALSDNYLAEATPNEEIIPQTMDSHAEGNSIVKDNSTSSPEIKLEDMTATVTKDPHLNDDINEKKSGDEIAPQTIDSKVDEIIPQITDSHVEDPSIVEDNSTSSSPEIKLIDETSSVSNNNHLNDIGEIKSGNDVALQTADPNVKDLNQIQKDNLVVDDNTTQSSSEAEAMNVDSSKSTLSDIPTETTSKVHANVIIPEVISETKPNNAIEDVSAFKSSDETLNESLVSQSNQSTVEPTNLVERILTSKDGKTSLDDTPKDLSIDQGNYKSSTSKTDADNVSLESLSSNNEKNGPQNDQEVISSNDNTPLNLNETSSENIPEDDSQQLKNSESVSKPEINNEPNNLSSNLLPTESLEAQISNSLSEDQSKIPVSSSENTQNDVDQKHQLEPMQVDSTINSNQNPINKEDAKASIADLSLTKLDANATSIDKQNATQNKVEEKPDAMKDDTMEHYNHDDAENLINAKNQNEIVDDFKSKYYENPYIF